MIDSMISEDEQTAIHQLGEATASISKTLADGRDIGYCSRKLSALFSDNSECIFLKDRERRLVFSNESFNQSYSRYASSPIDVTKVSSPVGLITSSFMAPSMEKISKASDELIYNGCKHLKLHHMIEYIHDGFIEMVTVKLPMRGVDNYVQGIIGISQMLPRADKRVSDAELQRLGGIVKGLRKEELQVARMVCDGVSNKSIAERIDAPQRTVENRRRNILKKLGLDSTAGLIKLMVRLEDAGLTNLGV